MKVNGGFLVLTHLGAFAGGFFWAADMGEENYSTMIAYFGWGWITFAAAIGLMFAGLIIARQRSHIEDQMGAGGTAGRGGQTSHLYAVPQPQYGNYGPAMMPMQSGQFPTIEGEFRRSGDSNSVGVSGGNEFR